MRQELPFKLQKHYRYFVQRHNRATTKEVIIITKIMGSKESKLKEAFEEIDTSGDKKVSVQELMDFTKRNDEKAIEIFKDFSKKEQDEFSLQD